LAPSLLFSVAAAHGLIVKGGGVDDVIREIEAAADDADEPLMLE